MCDPVSLGFLAGTAGTTTAAGATGLAATLQGVGTALSIVGTVGSAISANRAAKDTAAQIEEQKKTEAQLTSVRSERSRQKFFGLIADQRAQLAARGVSLDSPTAVFLGQTAAREMSFEAQTIQQGGQATQTELTASQRAVRARGRSALWKGGFSAAGNLLNAAPDLWPELLT